MIIVSRISGVSEATKSFLLLESIRLDEEKSCKLKCLISGKFKPEVIIKFEKSLGISKLIGPLNYCIALLNACFDTSSKYTNLSNQPSANTLASSVSEI